MLTRIELTNFMSHTATVIEPAAGLTVLVGPNNCGKSAVVAALQLLCQNPEAKFAVRHGAKECVVKVQTDDGHTVVWRRKEESANYDLDGTRYDRLGQGGTPEALHDLLRLPVVGSESDVEFDIHFGSQKSPIFLLNSKPPIVAKFFASSSDAIRLVEMQRRHNEKFAEKEKHRNRLEAESKQLTEELDRLEPALELDRRLKSVFEDYGKLLRSAELLQQADRDAAVLAAQAQVVAARKSEHDALRPLKAPPQLADPRPLQSLGSSLARGRTALQRATAQSQVLAVLLTPPLQFDVAALAKTCLSLIDLIQIAQRTEAARSAILPLAAPPALADVEARQRMIGQLAAAEQQRQVAECRCAAMQQLVSPPLQADAASLAAAIQQLNSAGMQVLRETHRLAVAGALVAPLADADLTPLRDCVNRLREAEGRVLAAEREAQQAEQQVTAVRAELREFAETEVCPTCGSPLDAERLLERAAVGLGGHSHD